MNNVNKSISKVETLLGVSNMEKSKTFYETVLEQKVMLDAGGLMVKFESGFSLQYNYVDVVEGGETFAPNPTGAKLEIQTRHNSCQIGFEVEDLEYWVTKVKSAEGIELIHDIAEYNWGQLVFRFYDFDGHIVEIGESEQACAKRLLAQGLSIDEIAKRTWSPVEVVQQLLGK